jgi:hypothetical protein
MKSKDENIQKSKERESNTFELEEHKLSEIIKSSEKQFDDINEHSLYVSPSKDLRKNFQKKGVNRQNLKSNLYPESENTSLKNLWSTNHENTKSIQNFLEFCQNTHSRGALMQSDSSFQPDQRSINSKMGRTLKEKLSRQSGKQLFESGIKPKPRTKLFSMRKKAKQQRIASSKHLQLTAKSNSKGVKVIKNSRENSQVRQQITKFHIQKARLSKEDFSFPKHKLRSMFEGATNTKSKKSFLEKKLGLKASMNQTPGHSKMKVSRRQNSIFKETQAKFEENGSSMRAANILQKIVSKDKKRRETKWTPMISKQSLVTNEGVLRKHIKINRTRTREFLGEGDLSESLEFKAKVKKQSQSKVRKNSRFYYKKNLHKQMRLPEV